MLTAEDVTRHHEPIPGENPWVNGRPQPEPIEVVGYDPSWPATFESLARIVRAALGDVALSIEHVGSTSVPGLAAKPVIDVDLAVADSADEDAYVPALERAGFALVVREPRWHQHRCLRLAEPRSTASARSRSRTCARGWTRSSVLERSARVLQGVRREQVRRLEAIVSARPDDRARVSMLVRVPPGDRATRSGCPTRRGKSLPMAMVDELKTRMTEAMRGKDDVAKNIYRLAYSEMQLASARSGKEVHDDEAISILKKLVKSNEETFAVATDAAQREALSREIALLTAMLPKTLGVPEIVGALAPVADAIRAAGNDGQATGVAMKYLKSTGAAVDGKTVAAAVKQIRS